MKIRAYLVTDGDAYFIGGSSAEKSSPMDLWNIGVVELEETALDEVREYTIDIEVELPEVPVIQAKGKVQ